MSNTPPKPLDDAHLIVMAKVGKPYGLKGYNTLKVYTEAPAALSKHANWFSRTNDTDWQPITFHHVRVHGQKLIAQLNQASTPDEATQLTGTLIGVLKTDLPALEAEHYYHHQLYALSVINVEGEVLGTLNHIWSNGAHDVFEVKGEKTRILPYIKSVVKSVDLKEKVMHVDWPYDF
jgi:16S rRNA processing protein RimM